MPHNFLVIPAIDQAAIRAIRTVRRLFRKAVAALREGHTDEDGDHHPPIPQTAIEDAVEGGEVDAVLEHDSWIVFARILGSVFATDGPLAKASTSVVARTAAEAPLRDLIFDRRAARAAAIRWLERHGAEQVAQITESTRAGVRTILEESFRGPFSRREVARRLARAKGFGLTEKQGENLMRWMRRQAANGKWDDLTERAIQYRIDREFRRRVRQRAGVVAHFEAYDAIHQARLETYRSAVDQGEIDAADYVLEWVTRGFNVCPRCDALDRRTAEILGGVFVSRIVEEGRYAGEIIRVARPLVHPYCYCALRIRARIDVEPTVAPAEAAA